MARRRVLYLVAALAFLSGRSGLGELIFSESFDGERLSPAWTVDRSAESKGVLRLERGRLVLTAEEARYHHIERRLGIDGTDAMPLRVDCQIWASVTAGLPTVLALYWGPDCVLGVGPAFRNWGENGPRAYWVIGKERGASPVEYGLGSRDLPAHYRITVTKRDVSAWASRDGETYWRIASFERGPGRFEGAPELLILGRGWVGDRPEQQKPDLDNDIGNIYQRQLLTFVFDALSVSTGPPSPDVPLPGYEKGEDWESTLDAYRYGRAPGPWFVMGPLAPRRGLYGPELEGMRFPKLVVREGDGLCVELPTTPELNGVQNGDYTLAAWVRPDSVPPGERPEDAAYAIIMKPGWHLGLYYSHESRFVMNHVLADGTQVAAKSANTFAPGKFYHVAGVVSTKRGAVEIYVGGKLEGSASFPAGRKARDYGDAPWRLGIALPGATDWRFEMDGAIDDVRIYSAALPAEDIASICAGRSPPVLIAAVADGSDGRRLTLVFDSPTNRPRARTKAEIDGLVSFGSKRLGSSYSGSWRDDRTLVISIQDPTGADLAPGDTVKIIADGKADLKNKTETSLPCTSAVKVSGSWSSETPEGLVGWWRLDEKKGEQVADSSGKGNHGRLIRSSDKGSWSWSAEGALPGGNGSIRFKYWKHPDSNRTEGAYIEIPDNPSLNPRQGLTLALWANAVRWGGYGFYWPALIRKEGQYELSSHEVNRLRFYLVLPSGIEFIEAAAPPAGSWHHIAATYDGARMRLFVNGKEVASKPASGEIRSSSGRPLHIGTRLEGESKFYDGLLDDVRIYERALGESELADLAARIVPDGSLIGHWRLDETSSDTAFDSSGYGFHGRVLAGSWTRGVLDGAIASLKKELLWTRYEPGESDTSGIVDFARMWGTSEDAVAGLACMRIVAEEPRNERIVFDGVWRVEVFLNGMLVAISESDDETLLPGRRAVTVALERGENDLVFKVTRRHRGLWRFVCRTEPAEPAERLALLRRLISDFPDDIDRAATARLEVARVLESAGCVAAAADALAEAAASGELSPDDVLDAYRERLRLLRLLRDEQRIRHAVRELIERTPPASPERQELELELVLSAAREPGVSRKRIEEVLATIEKTTSKRLIRRALGMLAGLAEERSQLEERVYWLKRLLREDSADGLAVECAEAVLGLAPGSEGALSEGLELYKKALASYPASKYPLVAKVSAEAGKALAERNFGRALELFPLAWLRACLAESDAGAKLLQEADDLGQPPPPSEGPGKRDFARFVERIQAYLAPKEQLTGWYVVGPFDNTNWKAYTEEIVPPDRPDVTKPVRGKQWQRPPDSSYAKGFLDLRALMDADNVVAFLYREIEYATDEDTELRVGSDDGCTIWVNGKKLYEDREQRALVPDQIVVPVRFRKGKNSILVRVQNGTSDWAFTMRIGKGSRRQALELARLLYLFEYFPEKRGELANDLVKFESSLLNAGLLEEAKAVARALTRAFPQNPSAQAEGALRLAEHYVRRSKDIGAIIEFTDWIECCAERRAFQSERDILINARRLASSALASSGDLSGAAERLRRLARSDGGGDLKAWALAELGLLYRNAGAPQTAARYYREALRAAPSDEHIRRRSYAAIEEARRARPVAAAIESPAELQTLLRTADRAVKGGSIDRAVKTYQKALEDYSGGLCKMGSRYVGAAEYCADRLRTMGPEAVKAYRDLVDVRAKALYEKALERLDTEQLERVATLYPLSSVADDALNRAANIYLLRMAPDRAVVALRRLLEEHPDTDLDRAMVFAKLALAEELAGNTHAAVNALDELAKRYAKTKLTVGGKAYSVEEYVKLQKKRLSETEREGVALGGTGFEVRRPEDPVDVSARRSLWPSPYRHVSLRALLRDGALFFHTFDEAFCLEGPDGRLRWRSGSRGGPATLRFGGMPEAHVALSPSRVYTRSLVGGQDRSSRFAIEARDISTGELVWSTETAADLAGMSAASPPIFHGGTVYAAFRGGGEDSQQVWAVALDGTNGRVIWRTLLGAGSIGFVGESDEFVQLGDHLCAPAIGPMGRGDIYFSTDLGAVAALVRSNGAVRWISTYPRAVFPRGGMSMEKHILAARSPGRIVVGEDALYVAPRDTLSILCFSRANGSLLWKSDPCDAKTLIGLLDQHALLVQGLALECLDTRSGVRLWRNAPPRDLGVMYGACELASDGIWASTEKGLCRLRREDGALLQFVRWEELGVSGPIGNIAISGDTLIGLGETTVVALDLKAARGRPGLVRSEIPEAAHKAIGLSAPAQPKADFAPPLAVEWRFVSSSPVSIYEPPDSAPTERYLLLGDSIARLDVSARRFDWFTRAGLPPERLAFSKRLVLAVYPRHLLAIDRATGSRLWVHAMTPDDTGFAPDTRDGRPFGELYVGDGFIVARQVDSPHIHVIEARTGRRVSLLQVEGCLCAMPSGDSVIIGGVGEKGQLYVESREALTGKLTWKQNLPIVMRNWHMTRAFPYSDDMIFYAEGRLLRFDPAARRIVYNESIRPLESPYFRSEGGYLVLSGRAADRWHTVCLDPQTGKALLDEPTPGDDRFAHRFSPGRVYTVHRRDRARQLVCRKLPGGEELWRSPCGGEEEQSLGGLEAGRWWVELFGKERGNRAHVWGGIRRICYRMFELDGGAVRGEGELPGVIPDGVRPGGRAFCWVDGTLLFCGRDSIGAATGPLQMLAERFSQVREPSDAAGLFLAAYARLSRPALATATKVKLDGRLDDWQGLEPIKLNSAAQVRSMGGAWKGPEDLSAEVRVQWDRKYVYVAVDVTDDVFFPSAPGAALSSGDSLLIGIDPKDCGADAPDPMADIVVEIALVDGRARVRILFGPDSPAPECRVARTERGLAYEVAIPWELLRPSPEERPGDRKELGLGVAVIDKDGLGDVSAMELGYGLVRGVSPRLFAGVSLVGVERERLARYRKFIEQFPSHPLSWRLFERALQASPDPLAELEGFVRADPRGAHVGRALATLAMECRLRGESFQRRLEVLAPLVPKERLGDAVGPSTASGGLGRAIRQWVFLDPENPPDAIMLQIHCSEGWWSRRAYWGADRFPWWGRHRTRERWPMGPLPPVGTWTELVIPVDALELGGHTIHHISFVASNGRAWWDRTEYISDGNVQVLIDDELPQGMRFEGQVNWVDSPVRSGRRSHTAGIARGIAEYRTDGTSLGIETKRPSQAASADAEPSRRIELLERGAHVLSDEPEAIELLEEAERLRWGAGRNAGEEIQKMYEQFLRANPRSQVAHIVLKKLKNLYEVALREEALRRCETLMDELRLDREQRRLFYREFSPGIRHWKVLGYFTPNAGRRNLEAALEPESFPVALGATYAHPEQGALRWRDIRTDGESLKLWEILPAPKGGEYPVAYLYTRLYSPRQQRVVLYMGCEGALRAWLNGRLVATSSWGGYLRDSFAVPVELNAGTNDILLKVVHQYARARVSCRIGDTSGKPLEDVVERPPLEVVHVSGMAEPSGVRVVFSVQLDKTSAEKPSNYRIDRGVIVESARLEDDGRTVRLETSPLERGVTYTLTVGNVRDAYTPPASIAAGTTRQFRVLGAGKGLLGQYFDNIDFTALKLTRVDPTVDFDWGNDSPHPSLGPDTFSVRWVGYVEPLFSENYNFYTVSDDGVRLWVDGKLIIDNWTDHAPTEDVGSIELTAYRKYSIKLEMYENGGGAVAKLLWSSPSQPKEVVPTTQLYPPD